MKPGFHKMSADDYHRDPAPVPSLSSGIAHTLLAQSPRHAWTRHPRLNPDYRDENDPKFDLGTVAHAMLLEGNDSGLVVVQAEDWRTKDAQQQRAAAWAVRRPVILAHQEQPLRAMVGIAKDYLARSELAGILEDGAAELTGLWQEGKAWCRIRPDLWSEAHSVILDYKTTTASAEPEQVIRQRVPSYELQAGLYVRGVKEITGQLPRFVYLFQETEPPFACSLIGLSPAWQALCDQKAQAAITLWTHCMATNKWPDYGARICWAEPPAWQLAKWEESENFNLDEVLPK